MELNKIYNMDCLEGMKEIPDKYFDLAIVDPPYGIGANKEKAHNGWKDYGVKQWDNETPKKEYFDELFRVSKNQIIWGANYMIENLYSSQGWIFWDKGQRNFSLADGELAWSSFNKALRVFTFSRGKLLQERGIHPTQKPIALYEWLLTKYANKGDKILDTHVGSASSLIACHNLDFEYMGFELDEDYYKLALKRLNGVKNQIKFNLF